MVHFGEFLKNWSLRSNSVTRQVNFKRTKFGGKCQNWIFQMRHFGWFSNTVLEKNHYCSCSYHPKKVLAVASVLIAFFCQCTKIDFGSANLFGIKGLEKDDCGTPRAIRSRQLPFPSPSWCPKGGRSSNHFCGSHQWWIGTNHFLYMTHTVKTHSVFLVFLEECTSAAGCFLNFWWHFFVHQKEF